MPTVPQGSVAPAFLPAQRPAPEFTLMAAAQMHMEGRLVEKAEEEIEETNGPD